MSTLTPQWGDLKAKWEAMSPGEKAWRLRFKKYCTENAINVRTLEVRHLISLKKEYKMKWDQILWLLPKDLYRGP